LIIRKIVKIVTF